MRIAHTDEELKKSAIKALIKKENPVIFEIGAYDGKDSRQMNAYFNNATFFCFEADPRSQNLFKTFSTPKNIYLQETAIGSIDGRIELNLSDSDTRRHYPAHSWCASSSIRKPKYHLELFEDVEFNSSISVPCVRLDTWFEMKTAGIELIDFIWCDINGAEIDFILGAMETLNKRTRFLYIEFSDKELYEGQITKDDILKLLPNFELMGVYNFKGNFGNLLLKNKNL